jgi:hypothetical protein
MNLHY